METAISGLQSHQTDVVAYSLHEASVTSNQDISQGSHCLFCLSPALPAFISTWSLTLSSVIFLATSMLLTVSFPIVLIFLIFTPSSKSHQGKG